MRTLTALAVVAGILITSAPVGAFQNFDDDDYHEIVLFNWDATSLDVLVLPAASPSPDARLAAVERSIDAWEAGIQELGAPWLTDALSIQRYTVGSDEIPQDALLDPEIVVVSGEPHFGVVFGIGAPSQYLTCQIIDLAMADAGLALGAVMAGAELEWHQHAASTWAVGSGTCWDTTQNYCIVVNTGWFLDPRAQHMMYDLSAHEFGHCLGIGHVGDALDYKAKAYPKTDIMSYAFYQENVHCVSSLNLRAIEGAFAELLGRPESEWRGFIDYVHVAQADYHSAACSLD